MQDLFIPTLMEGFAGQVTERPRDVFITTAVARKNKPTASNLTFGEVGQSAAKIASYLRNQGVRPGENIFLLSGNTPEAVMATLGVLLAGACPLWVNPTDDRPERIQFIMKHASVRWVFVENEPLLRKLSDGTPAEERDEDKARVGPNDGTIRSVIFWAPEDLPSDCIPLKSIVEHPLLSSTILPEWCTAGPADQAFLMYSPCE